MSTLTIEIWSDIVCPWCYIGKRRFETALAQFAHRDEVELVWRSFELDPGAPRRSPGTLNDMLARKMGVNTAQAAAMNAHVTELAAGEGLDYRLDQAQHGNTFDAHRLIHMAKARGLQQPAVDRLLRAYFTEGLPIGDHDTLATLGAEIGLPADEVRAMLAGSTYADAVRADEQRAAMFGIRGVPFFVLGEQFGVSGAQTSDVFAQALEQAWAAAHPLTLVGTGAAEGCDDGSCAVEPDR
jgi:predicted DsbA family dithiol-disulfide isomerase